MNSGNEKKNLRACRWFFFKVKVINVNLLSLQKVLCADLRNDTELDNPHPWYSERGK